MASDLPIYNIFLPQKVPLSKMFDDVIACDLWFPSPPLRSKILAMPMARLRCYIYSKGTVLSGAMTRSWVPQSRHAFRHNFAIS